MSEQRSDEERLRDAIKAMLREGLATPAELAATLNWSRQLVRYYARGIDWKAARADQVSIELNRRIADTRFREP